MSILSKVSAPLPDILEEAKRICDEAEKRGVVLRLFGGMAFRIRCQSATHRNLQRKYADIDVMGLKKQIREIRQLLTELGYTPRERFNALTCGTRLIFNDIANQRRIDVFLDTFEMCHKFDFSHRLLLDKLTLPLADLLATKLQVIKITDREYKDIIALLHDHELGETDAPEIINGKYLTQMCANNWGIYKTFTVNLGNVLLALSEFELDEEYKAATKARIQVLLELIEKAPKSIRWKSRATIGEKVQWYSLPEDDKEVIDSRRYGEREIQVKK